MTENIHIISNDFHRNEHRVTVDYVRPIIHSLNKDETMINSYERADQLADRPHIIVLGDSLGDARMADGSDADVVLKIGLLNKDIEKKLASYQEAFDIIIPNDGSVEYVNNILDQL